MNNRLHDMLLRKGYKQYSQDKESSGAITCKYQKRIDLDFPGVPLCTTNDKLFADVTYFRFPAINTDEPHQGVSINLRHGNNEHIWFDFQAYGIHPSSLIENEKLFDNLIIKLVTAWTVVNV